MKNLETSKTLKAVLLSAACLSTIALAGSAHHVNADGTNDPSNVMIVMKDGNHVVKKTTLAESDGVKLTKSAVAGQVPMGFKLADHQSYKPSDHRLELAVTSQDDTYIPVSMQFIDQNGKVISTGVVKGTPGWKMDLSSSLPNGYTFADSSQSTYTIPKSEPSVPLIIKVKATGAVSNVAQNTTISNEGVSFVCNGQVVGQGTVSGDKGAQQDISNIIPNGYKLADGASKMVPVDGNSHTVQVVSVNGMIGGGTTASTDSVKAQTTATINDQLVNFVDNGKIVGTAHVSGTKGSSVDVSGSVPSGYVASNASVTLTGDPATVQVSAKKVKESRAAEIGGESNVGHVGGANSGNVGLDQTSQHLASPSQSNSTNNGLIGGGTTATTDSVKTDSSTQADSGEPGLSSTKNSDGHLGIDGLTSEMANKTVSSDNNNGISNGDSTKNGGKVQKLSNDGVIGGGTTATTDGVNANGTDKNAGSGAGSVNAPSVNSNGGSESGVSNGTLGGGTTATTDGVSAKEGSESSSSSSSSESSSSMSSESSSSSSMSSSSSSEQGSDQGGQPANNKNGFAQTGGTGEVSHNSLYSLIYIKIPNWFHHLFK